jgi:hypothetical protein
MRKRYFAAAIALLAVLVTAATAVAATVTVTPSDTSWTQDDTRPGGTVSFTTTWGAPAGLGVGALELTTDATTSAKAGLYNHTMAGMPLADVTALAYWTYQASGPPHAAASYQLQIDVNGLSTPGGFTTLVYEPYQNGVVQAGVWQYWDVDAGHFWSTRLTPANGTCVLLPGFGGAPFYTLADVVACYPDAVVVGIGVNIGTNNPGYVVATDGVQLNDTVYDFEPELTPATKEDCKEGGWQRFNAPAFANQGECVSFVTHRDS